MIGSEFLFMFHVVVRVVGLPRSVFLVHQALKPGAPGYDIVSCRTPERMKIHPSMCQRSLERNTS